MKQIFDWMRKKPLKAFEVYDGSIGVYPCEVNRLIDEAEAKWEADCCEWKILKRVDEDLIVSPHEEMYRMCKGFLKILPFCPFCGKRIKISEVSNGMG